MAHSFEEAYFIAKRYRSLEYEIKDFEKFLLFSPRNENGSISITFDVYMQFHNIRTLIECLVIMFGDYDDCPAYGWIEKPGDAADWIYKLRHCWSSEPIEIDQSSKE